jgi:hypothetical protein
MRKSLPTRRYTTTFGMRSKKTNKYTYTHDVVWMGAHGPRKCPSSMGATSRSRRFLSHNQRRGVCRTKIEFVPKKSLYPSFLPRCRVRESQPAPNDKGRFETLLQKPKKGVSERRGKRTISHNSTPISPIHPSTPPSTIHRGEVVPSLICLIVFCAEGSFLLFFVLFVQCTRKQKDGYFRTKTNLDRLFLLL